MYQPAVPVVQFSQVPTQPAPVIQIMQQPQIPSYPPPALPPVVVQQVPETKSDDYCESYHRPSSCSNTRTVAIFLVVGIVGAVLVACVIVGVVVGLLITSSSAEVPRASCEQTVYYFPYEFYISERACVYGYYEDGVCTYDSYFDAKNNTDKPCYGKTFGADHISGRCYYNGDTTCHCNMAYREDENICYNFAIDSSRVAEGSCTHGLSTGDYCLYEKRQKQNRNNCPAEWDKVNDDYCYKRETKRCDKYPDNSISRDKCLKGIKIVVDAIN